MSTPNTALAQGTFDIVVQHAAGMTRQSREATGGLCMYRDGKGGACFAGALMSDDHVATLPSEMQVLGIHELREKGMVPEHMIPHMRLIAELQRVHDEPSHWHENGFGPPNKPVMRGALRRVADHFGLKADLAETLFAA
jgi:hypothetical protein